MKGDETYPPAFAPEITLKMAPTPGSSWNKLGDFLS